MNNPSPDAKQTLSELSAVLWLMLLHALADLALGLYRVREVSPEVVDVLAAALPRAQICLLAVWLTAGGERLSWRLAGLVGGVCFLFVVFSRTAFSHQHEIGPAALWLEEEWAHYFRLSGPGDLLIRTPVLILAVAAPLGIWRLFRRRGGETSRWKWPQFQFRMMDAVVWIVTLSLGMAALFRTAPYREWLTQLGERLVESCTLETRGDVYVVASSVLYVGATYLSLAIVFSPKWRTWSAALGLPLLFGAAYGFEAWLRLAHQAPKVDPLAAIRFSSTAETVTCVVATGTLIGSLSLYKFYQHAKKLLASRSRGASINQPNVQPARYSR